VAYFFSFCKISTVGGIINALNAELNPICHILALLGAHHILHVSRLRVKQQNWYAWIYVSLRRICCSEVFAHFFSPDSTDLADRSFLYL
jgi:hypothetical protein